MFLNIDDHDFFRFFSLFLLLYGPNADSTPIFFLNSISLTHIFRLQMLNYFIASF